MVKSIENIRFRSARDLLTKMASSSVKDETYYFASTLPAHIKKQLNIPEAWTAIIEIYPQIDKIRLSEQETGESAPEYFETNSKNFLHMLSQKKPYGKK